MNDPSQMMSRGFQIWPAAPAEDVMPAFRIPHQMFAGQAVPFSGRVHWKGKKSAAGKRKKHAAAAASASAGGGGGGPSAYKPPALQDLQMQNRAKARRFYPKKKHARFAPFAPRNTTSFIIRSKRSGGIASLVSPCPVTPAILPTPTFSPTREGLVDMAKEEWGVDGYGSMKGIIRLRSPTREDEGDDNDSRSRSSESDMEEHLGMERRLDHDLSRFKMVYPSSHGGEDAAAAAAPYLLESRADDRDTHIAQLEEENLTLKERMFLMEQEVRDLRRRLQLLEMDRCRARRNNRQEVNMNILTDGEMVEVGSDLNYGGGDSFSEKSIGNDGDEDVEEDNAMANSQPPPAAASPIDN